MQSTERREQKGITENQEIDIFDLLLQLWKGKKIILCTMVFALIIAIAYLIFHKPKWISTAVVSLPETGQVADYTNALLALYPPSYRKEGATNPFLPSIMDIRTTAYGRFSALLSARIGEEALKKKVSAEPLKMTQASSMPTPIQVSYTAKSPEQLDTTLRTLLEEVSRDVEKQIIDDLKTAITLRKQQLAASLAIQDKLAKEQRTQRLDDVKEAVQTSRGGGDGAGSEALVVLKNDAAGQLNFADEYLSTQEQLLKVTSLKPKNMKVGTFFYVIEPRAAEIEQKQNVTVIVLLSLILGGIFGSGIVLTQSALHNYRQRR